MATYYVATDGDDGNPGTLAEPFLTIQAGAYAADAAGDVVIVQPGTYQTTATNGVVLQESGDAGNPITIMAAYPGAATLDGTQTSQYGFLFYRGASHIVLDGFTVTGYLKHGLSSNTGSSHVLIKRCMIHTIGGVEDTSAYGLAGIYTGYAPAKTSKHTIEQCVFHSIGRSAPEEKQNLDHGIYTTGDDTVIRDCLFYDCDCGWCISIDGWAGLDNVLVDRCTFVRGAHRGHVVLGNDCANVTVQRCVSYDACGVYPEQGTDYGFVGFWTTSEDGISVRDNVVYEGTLTTNLGERSVTFSGNSEGSDPGLVDADNDKFTLSTGATARRYGAGARLSCGAQCPAKSKVAVIQ